MPSNNTGSVVRELDAAYPGRLGHLVGPGGWRDTVLPNFALDNGAFAAYTNGTRWDHNEWRRLCERVYDAKRTPMWAAVPDIVGDRLGTLVEWRNWYPEVRAYGWPAAFVLQDGMEIGDVPPEADVLFLGGTTAWKWRTLPTWGWFARNSNRPLHVGRVNGADGLWACHDAGAQSCDGTGWFRGDPNQLQALRDYLRDSSTGVHAKRGVMWLWQDGAA